MTSPAPSCPPELELRARQSLGSSDDAIYRMVEAALVGRQATGGRLVDVGCGGGGLWRRLGDRFSSYCGVDAIRYDAFPANKEFLCVDLDSTSWPLSDASADVVAAVETIEHLENPWAFVRALVRIVRPGGWVVVTTPNQLSLLSLATLLAKRRFSSFQDVHYPAHRTALLESDLLRLAGAAGLESVALAYSSHGRLPLVLWHYPRALARAFPRALSDNLLVIGQRPA
jgi:2-polyprenyl-3-methyl-5-hydroxy-6-metoxy-1,4-benzoquinol methylase